MANPFAKSRKIDAPYAIYQAPGGWEWRVLKTYKTPASEAKDAYARWMVAAKSENTWGNFEMGDTYAKEVITYGRLVAATPEWLEARQAAGFQSWGMKVPTPEAFLASN
jgi:hypothetical protein